MLFNTQTAALFGLVLAACVGAQDYPPYPGYPGYPGDTCVTTTFTEDGQPTATATVTEMVTRTPLHPRGLNARANDILTTTTTTTTKTDSFTITDTTTTTKTATSSTTTSTTSTRSTTSTKTTTFTVDGPTTTVNPRLPGRR
ncbi:hypothetical protein A0H81_14075 [Grifola frondosa]|uniref:Uncharacterized protein n=1 Tax=Grifola frondosa TaxID=5627 RepID=A0A1C7LMA9_GRIFR|nr:hypothetical protein A0H81_14075 [Grifola frondosa]